MAPKAKPAPKAKAKLKRERAYRSNSRQAKRRQAVSELNGVAHEFGVEPIPVKAPCAVVEKLVACLLPSLCRQTFRFTSAVRARGPTIRRVSGAAHGWQRTGRAGGGRTGGRGSGRSGCGQIGADRRADSDGAAGGRGGGRPAAGQRVAKQHKVRN